MDGWQAVQNWAIFGVAVGGLAWYYYPKDKKVEKPQEKVKVREQQPAAPKPSKQQPAKRSAKPDAKVAFAPVTAASYADVATEANDDSARNFAEQMMKARKGTTLKSSDKSDTRVKTVKQGSALRSSTESSEPARARQTPQDDIPATTTTAATTATSSSSATPALDASGVADMLEPAAAGPTSLRIAPSQQPVKEKAPKQVKKEVVETKKQRQNRLKKETQKLQRDEEERARKALEEQQRRSAREARGEPAKNGIHVSKPPASSAWSSSNSGAGGPVPALVATSTAPLLDTFDEESTGSSNAGASTAATSTTENHQAQWIEDLPSEEEQMAALQAQDDGWNEVKSSKKQKKKADGDANGASTPVAPVAAAAPVVQKRQAAPATKSLANGKPIGFQALHDELDPSNDIDPNDASNWAA